MARYRSPYCRPPSLWKSACPRSGPTLLVPLRARLLTRRALVCVRLDIGRARFNGSLPSSLSTLHALEKLSVERNSFDGPIPTGLSSTSLSGGLCQLTSQDFDGEYTVDRLLPRRRKAGRNSFTCPMPADLPTECQSHAYCTSYPEGWFDADGDGSLSTAEMQAACAPQNEAMNLGSQLQLQ